MASIDSITPDVTAAQGGVMPYAVDFKNVSTVGLESSPHPDALAGLRANEARYFKTKCEQRRVDHRVGAPDPQGGA